MAAGGDTFINDMLERAGYINVFRHLPRYPVIDPATLAASGCRQILLSSEPYPFREKHCAEILEVLTVAGTTTAGRSPTPPAEGAPAADAPPASPARAITFVDGEMFSWYGSRLQRAPAYFRGLWQAGV